MATSKIYIIESIDLSKDQNGMLVYGEYLMRKINKSISASKYKKQISCELINVFGQYQWQKVWRQIRQECQQDFRPIIHFIAHGKPEGMIVAGYKVLKWRYVLQQLKRVNNLCGQELCVTMNVCHGERCITNLLTQNQLPFKFLLSTPDAVPLNIFNVANKNQHPFVNFYETLLKNANLNKALKHFGKTLPSKKEKDYSSWYLIYKDDKMRYNFAIDQIK